MEILLKSAENRKKVKEPLAIESPSFQPIIRLQRAGKFGNIIGVHKLRTMHAYSEYLQDYVVQQY